MYYEYDNDDYVEHTEREVLEAKWGKPGKGRTTYKETVQIGHRCLKFTIISGAKTEIVLDDLNIWIPNRRLSKTENHTVNQHILDTFNIYRLRQDNGEDVE